MIGVNNFTIESFTDDELKSLEGLELGSYIQWRGEFHQITQLIPLTVHASWDIHDDQRSQ